MAEKHLYLETKPKSGVFNYRGEPGDGDDAESFAALMEKQGLRVFVGPKKAAGGDRGIAEGDLIAAKAEHVTPKEA